MEPFRPMLAACACADLEALQFPLLCTPKFDGIRCLIRNKTAMSRTLKPIPNTHVRSVLAACPNGLDGELIVQNNYNKTQSGIMREDGEPDFAYHVFDVVMDAPYIERMKVLAEMELPPICKKVLPVEIRTRTSLLAYETRCLQDGYEGVMIRSPDGPYKCGRSTEKEGYLLKLKRFTDAEARIVDYEELMHNENPVTYDKRGYAKRASCQENLVPAGTLGCFVVEDDRGRQFKVSTGMTAEQRQEYWDNIDDYIGQFVKYKFQEHGTKDLPRFPVFLGFRSEDDM